jgi:hypothetical protein
MLKSENGEWSLIHNGKEIFILKLESEEGVDQMFISQEELNSLKKFLNELPK